MFTIDDRLTKAMSNDLVIYDSQAEELQLTSRLFYLCKREFKSRFNEVIAGIVLFEWKPIISNISTEMDPEFAYSQGTPVTILEDENMSAYVYNYLDNKSFIFPPSKSKIILCGNERCNQYIIGAY